MGLFSKIKDYLSEEVEEVEEFEPVKPKVEPVKPITKISTPVVSKVEEPTKSDDIGLKKEEKFVFPVYFDDKDFDDISKKEGPKKAEPLKRENRVEMHKESHRGPYKEAYSKKAEPTETKKTFKPTPIISPVYGVLDKNYYKEDIVVTPISRSGYYDNNRPITVDDVRKKAFGTLEDDLEKDLLFGSDLEVPKHGKVDDSIFNENDFANAVEEDMKRDISKDGLKSDIESLLDNKEFAKTFDYHVDEKHVDDIIKTEDTIIMNNKVEKGEDLDSNYGGHDDDYTIDSDNMDTYSDLEETDDELELPDNIANDVSEDLESSYSNDDLELSMDNDKELPNEIQKDSLDYGESIENETNLSKMADKEIEKAYADNNDLNDSDLFNLIDSMYGEEK